MASRLGLLVVLLGAVVLAGCGGSSRPKGPPAFVFVSTRDGDYAIFGADATAKHVWRLTKEKGNPATPAGLFFQVDPAWSPNGRLIAFSSRRDGVDHIYVMNADGTGTRRITDSAEEDTHPSWSPDGKRIVFSRGGALFVVSARGGKATRVGRGLGRAADPAWSPNGKLIAYSYRVPGTQVDEIWLMRADGTGIHQLTKLGKVSVLPAWSPDSERLVFSSNARGQHFQVYTIGVDGKDLTQLTVATTDIIQPSFLPDGKRIAFSRDGAIWVGTADRETQLTSGKGNDLSPEWRPLQGH